MVVSSVQRSVSSVQCLVPSVQRLVFSVQCPLFSVSMDSDDELDEVFRSLCDDDWYGDLEPGWAAERWLDGDNGAGYEHVSSSTLLFILGDRRGTKPLSHATIARRCF